MISKSMTLKFGFTFLGIDLWNIGLSCVSAWNVTAGYIVFDEFYKLVLTALFGSLFFC